MPDIFYGFLGLFVGSFLNVCIWRLPRGESIVLPPSHCPQCGRRLKAEDLFPVLSYLALRGRCRECQSPISPRYAVVELITGALCYLAAFYAADEVMFLKNFIFVSALLVIFFIDLDHYIIPDVVSLPMIAAGLAFAAAPLALGRFWPDAPEAAPGLGDAAIAGLVGFAGFYAIAVFGELLLKREAMGGGDIKLAAMMGCFLGTRALLVALFLSFLFGVVLGPLISMARGRGLREPVPFGPMMTLGAALALFSSEPIINWYARQIDKLWGIS